MASAGQSTDTCGGVVAAHYPGCFACQLATSADQQLLIEHLGTSCGGPVWTAAFRVRVHCFCTDGLGCQLCLQPQPFCGSLRLVHKLAIKQCRALQSMRTLCTSSSLGILPKPLKNLETYSSVRGHWDKCSSSFVFGSAALGLLSMRYCLTISAGGHCDGQATHAY